MFSINEFVMYRNEVCKIKDITDKKYYILSMISDDSLTVEVPVDNRLNLIKKVIDKKSAMNLINSVSEIEIIDKNDKIIENEYKKLLNTDDKEDLVKIIKTAYLRNLSRKNEGKKISSKDDHYFKKAEKILYNELAVSLDITTDQVKQLIIDTIKKKKETI